MENIINNLKKLHQELYRACLDQVKEYKIPRFTMKNSVGEDVIISPSADDIEKFEYNKRQKAFEYTNCQLYNLIHSDGYFPEGIDPNEVIKEVLK